jgi:hypothetical protein
VTYRLSYKRLDYHIAITVTTNGTGAGALTATLPVAATDSGIGVGRRDGVGGQMVQGVVSGSTMSILLYDNSYPGADGSSFNITGSYSIATEG